MLEVNQVAVVSKQIKSFHMSLNLPNKLILKATQTISLDIMRYFRSIKFFQKNGVIPKKWNNEN